MYIIEKLLSIDVEEEKKEDRNIMFGELFVNLVYKVIWLEMIVLCVNKL